MKHCIAEYSTILCLCDMVCGLKWRVRVAAVPTCPPTCRTHLLADLVVTAADVTFIVARCCLQLRPSLPSFNLIFVLVFEFHHSFMGIIYLSRVPEGTFRQDIWTYVGHELSFSGCAWVELRLTLYKKLTLVMKTLGFIHWSSMSLL
jgi:hypothetical protein